MNIPKKMTIGGQEYDIKFPYKFEERDDIFGRADYAKGTIFITNTDGSGSECSEDHCAVTFWHEIMHIINRIYCMDEIGKEYDEEKLMDGLAYGLNQILSENFQPLIALKKNKLVSP